jgi:hypothetical protein
VRSVSGLAVARDDLLVELDPRDQADERRGEMVRSEALLWRLRKDNGRENGPRRFLRQTTQPRSRKKIAL